MSTPSTNSGPKKSSQFGDKYTSRSQRQEAPRPECLADKTPEQLDSIKKAMLRKLDTRLMPTLVILFLLNILDRNNFTNARLGGLEDDIGIDGHQYNTALMIMYAGYLLFQFPSNVILSKFPRPGIYLSVAACLWGGISASMASAHSYGQVLAIRFFLGSVEAPFFPGALLILTSWYSRAELPPRIAFLYAGNTLSNCFGGLIAAGVLDGMEGVGGLRAWRWLFIIEGCLTITVAIGAGFILPNYPKDTKWLTEEEREYAVWRLTNEAGGVEDEDENASIWKGALEALVDPKVYMLILLQLSLLAGMAFTNFFPTIMKTLNKSNIVALLLTAPPYFLAFFTSIGNSLHSGKTNERAFHIAAPLTISMLGNILAITLESTAGRYAAMFLMTLGVYSAFNVALSWISSTIPRPKAKRAAALAMVNSVANCTHLFTSYLYPDSDKPRFLKAGLVLATLCGVCAITALTLRFWLKRENSKLDKEEGFVPDSNGEFGANEHSNVFRYVL